MRDSHGRLGNEPAQRQTTGERRYYVISAREDVTRREPGPAMVSDSKGYR